MADDKSGPFYLRIYQGHGGRFGNEAMEIELHGDGRLKYRNRSAYRGSSKIQKAVTVGSAVVAELRRIVAESGIVLEDDEFWPPAGRGGTLELEIKLGDAHVCLLTAPLRSAADIEASDDPEGLRTLHELVQDVKCFVLSLIALHFKLKPV
eukprot:PLAT14423.1.p2 GENE.PLAT14423.1~~PLAT14423.1.p2  ORF type:complete len:151 (+),score=55.34 PLAT14423.1:3-455(+)